MIRAVVPLSFVAVLTALALAGVTLGTIAAGGLPAGFWPPLLACIVAVLLYAVSHLMRAVRLAVIAMPFLGVSFRTVVALHLFVAPWSLLLPFKLDELIRLNELCRVSHSLPRAIATVLIDRSMDGLILLALTGYLQSTGHADMASFVGFVGAGLTLIAIGFIVLPLLLETTQRHLFIYNHSPKALLLLKSVSGLRELLSVSRQTIRDATPFLLLTTLGIWCLELLAIWAVLTWGHEVPDALATAVASMLNRADDSWRSILTFTWAANPISQATILFYIALVGLWVPASIVYAWRRRLEPRRPRLPARTGFSRLPPTKGAPQP